MSEVTYEDKRLIENAILRVAGQSDDFQANANKLRALEVTNSGRYAMILISILEQRLQEAEAENADLKRGVVKTVVTAE